MREGVLVDVTTGAPSGCKGKVRSPIESIELHGVKESLRSFIQSLSERGIQKMSAVSTSPDRGGGLTVNRWWQLVAAVAAMMAIANLQYAWTLFTTPLVAHFFPQATEQAAKLVALAEVGAAFSGFVLAETWLVPFEAALVDRFGPRAIIMFGGVLVGIG